MPARKIFSEQFADKSAMKMCARCGNTSLRSVLLAEIYFMSSLSRCGNTPLRSVLLAEVCFTSSLSRRGNTPLRSVLLEEIYFMSSLARCGNAIAKKRLVRYTDSHDCSNSNSAEFFILLLRYGDHAGTRKYMLAFSILAIRKTAGSQTVAWTFYRIFCGRHGGGFHRIFSRNNFERLRKIFVIHRRGIFDFSCYENASTRLFFGKRHDKKAGIFHGSFRKPDQRESNLVLHNRAHVFCPAIQSRFSPRAFGGIFPPVYRSSLQFSLAFHRSFLKKIFCGPRENRKHCYGSFAVALRAQFDFHLIFFHEKRKIHFMKTKSCCTI